MSTLEKNTQINVRIKTSYDAAGADAAKKDVAELSQGTGKSSAEPVQSGSDSAAGAGTDVTSAIADQTAAVEALTTVHQDAAAAAASSAQSTVAKAEQSATTARSAAAEAEALTEANNAQAESSEAARKAEEKAADAALKAAEAARKAEDEAAGAARSAASEAEAQARWEREWMAADNERFASISTNSAKSAKSIGTMRTALDTVTGGVDLLDKSLSRIFFVVGILDAITELYQKFREWTGVEAKAQKDAEALNAAKTAAEQYGQAVEKVGEVDKRVATATQLADAEEFIIRKYEHQRDILRDMAIVEQQAFALRAQREGNASDIAQAELDLALIKKDITQEEYTIQSRLLKEKEAAMARQLEEEQAAARTAAALRESETTQEQLGAMRQSTSRLGNAVKGFDTYDQYDAAQQRATTAQSELRAYQQSADPFWGKVDRLKRQTEEAMEPIEEMDRQLREQGYRWTTIAEKAVIVREIFMQIEKQYSTMATLQDKVKSQHQTYVDTANEELMLRQQNAREAETSAAIINKEVEGLAVKTAERKAEAQEQASNLQLDKQRLALQEQAAALTEQQARMREAGVDSSIVDQQLQANRSQLAAVDKASQDRSLAERESQVATALVDASKGSAIVAAAQQATAALAESTAAQRAAIDNMARGVVMQSEAIQTTMGATVSALAAAQQKIRNLSAQISKR